MKNISNIVMSNIGTSNIIPHNQNQFDISLIYKKIQPLIHHDMRVNRNVIDCLKLAGELWTKYCDSTNKSSKTTSIILHKFKILEHRLFEQLDNVYIQGTLQPITHLKKQIKSIIREIQKSGNKYWEYENQLKEGSKIYQEQIKQKQTHQEDIKEQMLEIVQRFKTYAKQIGSTIDKDTYVIKQINNKQDNQLGALGRTNKSIKSITSTQMGFLELIVYGIIGMVLWTICMMFILFV